MDDLLGWQTTRWGMTTDEILAALDGVPAQRIPREELLGSGYVDLKLPTVNIETFPFTVRLAMSNEGRLVRVSVGHSDDTDFTDPKQIFEAARRLLTERFGKPERVGTTDQWRWSFPTTQITLQQFYMPDVVSSVVVVFAPAETRAATPTLSAF